MHDNQNAIRDSCCISQELSKNVFQSKIHQLWKVTSFFLNKVSWFFGPNLKLSDFAQIGVESIYFWVAESEYALRFVIPSNPKKLGLFKAQSAVFGHNNFYCCSPLIRKSTLMVPNESYWPKHSFEHLFSFQSIAIAEQSLEGTFLSIGMLSPYLMRSLD